MTFANDPNEIEQKLKVEATGDFWKGLFLENPNSMILTTEDFQIIEVNASASRLFHQSLISLKEQNLLSLPISVITQNGAVSLKKAISFSDFFEKSSLQGKLILNSEYFQYLEISSQPYFDGHQKLILWTFQDITELKSADRLLDFFAQRLSGLESSLQIEETIQKALTIVGNYFADWCRIDLIQDSHLQLAGVYHADKSTEEQIWKLDSVYPCGNDERFSVAQVIRSGSSEFVPLCEKVFSQSPRVSDRIRALQRIGLASYISTPIRNGKSVIGCITMAKKSSASYFTDIDLVIAEELASKIGIAIEKAQLYKKLEDLKDQAEAASKSKSQFLANVSHEIRTPLGAVLGFSDLILNKEHPEKDKRIWASKIRVNGERLLRIIDDILDMSKVEAGKLDIFIREIDLKGLLQDLYSTLNNQAVKKNVALKVEFINPISRFIHSDDTRLTQILSNLIGNALKFTTQGTVTLRISEQTSNSGSQICFSIEDTGVGLTQEQASRLFRPFSQADSSHARQFGGTGLGLALSHRLAQKISGDLTLKSSAPGKGSTFLLCLNVGNIDRTRTFESLDYKEKEDTAGLDLEKEPQLDGLKILLVEDSPDNQMLISTYIETAGGQITIASDGQEGVNKALSGSYDLILMDIQMPIKDGYEATRELRQLGYQGPIVALTAHAMKTENEKCLKAGCNAHISKPILKKDLIQAITKTSSAGNFYRNQRIH